MPFVERESTGKRWLRLKDRSIVHQSTNSAERSIRTRRGKKRDFEGLELLIALVAAFVVSTTALHSVPQPINIDRARPSLSIHSYRDI
jgi:hypothetical protein